VTFYPMKPAGVSDDPILNQVRMGLTSSGNEISQIVARSGTANTGANIMNAFAGLMAQGSSRGAPTTAISQQGSSAGPAIAAGVAGLAMGIAGGAAGAALLGGGNKKVATATPAPAPAKPVGPAPSAAPVVAAGGMSAPVIPPPALAQQPSPPASPAPPLVGPNGAVIDYVSPKQL
jgi:hypothetical protein